MGRATGLIAIVLALAPALASAGEPAARKAPPKKPTQSEDIVVVTGTRTPERSQRATVRTDVVTRDEAERRGATNVADALATQPGVNLNPGSYGYLGGVSAVQIQGFDRDRVLILEDGERIVGDVGGAIDLAAIPTGDVERIEIVAGPTSSLYGSAALGGVINVVTAPPRLQGPSGRVRLEGRSHLALLTQGGAAYRKEGEWIGLDASFFRMDGLERGEGLPDLRIPQTTRRLMLGVRGGFALGERMDVRVRLRAFNDRLDGLESQVAPGLGRYLIDLPTTTQRYTAHVVHVTNLGGGSSLRLTLGRQWVDNTTARDRRASPLDEQHDRLHRMQSFEAVATLADGRSRTWVLGSRFEAEHFEQSFTQTQSTGAGTTTTMTSPEVIPVTLGVAAVYGQLSWKVGDFTVMPGVRTELHTRYGESVAPRLALAWRPSPIVTVRVSGGRGFRAPSAKELGFVFDHSVFGYRVVGNHDLSPEKSWGTNADVTLSPTPTATLRGGVYANWVADLIDLDVPNGRVENGVAEYTYRNFGEARTAGAQLGAQLRPASWIRADAIYDYAYTRDVTSDQPLPARPPSTMTTSVRMDLPLELELYARARVTSDAFLDPSTRAPGYQSIDVRLSRNLWPKAQAYVGVLNLLDVRPDPGRLGDTRPPLGRIIYIGARADFPWEEP
jgi:outer membrane receptor for ferrienterochelin and colicins